MGNSLLQRLHHIALILVLWMSCQRISVSRISTVADSVFSKKQQKSWVPGLVKTKHLKKKYPEMLPPYPQIPWSSFTFLFYPYSLEITRKETAEECCHSYAMLSIDCHFRNAYRKVKQLGMSPPIQQHQKLPSLLTAPLLCSCIPVCIFTVAQINEERHIVKHWYNTC